MIFAHAADRITKAMQQIDRWAGQIEIGIEECKAEIEVLEKQRVEDDAAIAKCEMSMKVAREWLNKTYGGGND